MQESGPDPKHIHNTHVIIDKEGSVRATYRKVHLFDVEVENGPVLMESRSTAPGREVKFPVPRHFIGTQAPALHAYNRYNICFLGASGSD